MKPHLRLHPYPTSLREGVEERLLEEEKADTLYDGTMGLGRMLSTNAEECQHSRQSTGIVLYQVFWSVHPCL